MNHALAEVCALCVLPSYSCDVVIVDTSDDENNYLHSSPSKSHCIPLSIITRGKQSLPSL